MLAGITAKPVETFIIKSKIREQADNLYQLAKANPNTNFRTLQKKLNKWGKWDVAQQEILTEKIEATIPDSRALPANDGLLVLLGDEAKKYDTRFKKVLDKPRPGSSYNPAIEYANYVNSKAKGAEELEIKAEDLLRINDENTLRKLFYQA